MQAVASSSSAISAAAALAAQEAAEDAEASLNCTAAPMFYRDRLSECQRAEADTHQVCSYCGMYIQLVIVESIQCGIDHRFVVSIVVLAATGSSSTKIAIAARGRLLVVLLLIVVEAVYTS
jgi:hypothetical protein